MTYRPPLAVAAWPTYLLRNVPENVRLALKAEAVLADMSISDVIRGVLCERYKYHCPPASDHFNGGGGTATAILLRLQPRLHKRLLIEAKDTHTSVRSIIIRELEREYL